MVGDVGCPGCGVALPPSGWLPDRRLNASPECWQVHGEVMGLEYQHPELVRRFHQLTVDAYGAQHAGGPTKQIRVAYSLVGLYLALDCGFSGLQVRDAHQQMGKPAPWWPAFPRPAQTGALTVLDVAAAGARAGSVEGHARLVAQWAGQVWAAWAEQHVDVAELARQLGLRGAPTPGQ